MKLIGIVIKNERDREFVIRRVPYTPMNIPINKLEEVFLITSPSGGVVEYVIASKTSARTFKGHLPEEGLAHFIMANWDLLHSEVK
jgi:hypothetical protein